MRATLLVLCYACTKPAPAPQEPLPDPLPQVPQGFDRVQHPQDNLPTPAKVALGNLLFFDTRLSGDGSRSCYSCHQCEHGLTDGLPTAVGAFAKPLPRNSPTLWNIGYHQAFYWDGRSPTLEAQALAAWTGANMGADPDKVAQALAEPLGARFQAAFGGPPTPDNIVQALAAYERTLFCADTAWDQWQNGAAAAISEEAKVGWEVFRKVGCGQCHAGALFTDLRYHNVGAGKSEDPGRFKVTQDPADTGAFKTPSLRDVANSAPYFHDGTVATLEEAVDFMLAGGKPNPNLDAVNLRPQAVTAQERAALLRFLQSLGCVCNIREGT
jgi:cytochrome c peroxidase